MKKLIIAASLLSLMACSDETATPLLYTVTTEKLEVEVPAKGELFAAKATNISAPMTRRGMQNLAWLAPEFTRVKKGDVIARIDGEAMMIKAQEKTNELAITREEITEKNASLEQQISALKKDIGMIDQEKDFADRFSIDDIRIQSKLEILDQMQNAAYLGSKQEYLLWKNDSFSESSEGELGLLQMREQQHQSKIDQFNQSLALLEVKAPHDGLLTYKTNWRGEKPRAGQSVWPGEKIAQLPDISNMKAKLFVLENEAINLQAGQKVDFYLNVDATTKYSGKIDSVAPFPKSVKRGNPQKYFEVTVELDTQQPQLFMPGRKLEAIIHVASVAQPVIVPLQSVFTVNQQTVVYRYHNGEFVETPVTLGQSSLSHVEITQGLDSGEQISLTNKEHG
ncbi:HlyD family efflux transporter periplasmic adaptor subunit [Psychrobium sp. MM17-31]|uniref:efflux RND transporter periplasmic adaptor subunit n=1 Tax=Psychrobium sp. MM17-31 TaxID=2917758 RepID=UPI001EF55C87|nr:HlyD family efflux transporter periplasmic adaptor subunit [Psychrobium sp. MM17-31]MCG7532461.1 HlyD family efflux transporter periplasmic adaptor subunit [Psychrobium sp. MM17-31]